VKIAHFSWEFPPVIYGGLGTFAAELTKKQDYFGNKVTVFSLNQDNKFKAYEKWNGISVYRPKTLDLTDYWISYSYLDTKRDFVNYPSLATPTFATPHTFSVVVKHWIPAITTSLGITYTFATGRPYYNPNNPEFLGDKAKNYNNLSLNASYLTTIFDNFTVIFFSIDNIIGFENIFGYNYSADGTVRRPVLPTADRAVFLGMFISVGQASPF